MQAPHALHSLVYFIHTYPTEVITNYVRKYDRTHTFADIVAVPKHYYAMNVVVNAFSRVCNFRNFVQNFRHHTSCRQDHRYYCYLFCTSFLLNTYANLIYRVFLNTRDKELQSERHHLSLCTKDVV